MISLKRGDVLLDKYRIENVLGKGGMGIVVCARHIQLDDRVAIKLLLPDASREPGAEKRFVQEARAARKIKSEHVAQVSDVGVLPTGESYIVMEYLEGRDLAEVRRERGRLSIEEVVDYVLQACEALAEAHAQGIVHRDLKPANLFLTRRADGSPLVKVLDFGISKLCGRGVTEQDPGVTRTGTVLGSPSYMAPEQIVTPKLVDSRTDIWSLGVILYLLLTGSLPFRGETMAQTLVRILQFEPDLPSKTRPELPPALEDVILRCLEKNPDRRFFHVAALATALKPFAPVSSRPSVERISRVIGISPDVGPPVAELAALHAGARASSIGIGEGSDKTRTVNQNTAAMSAWNRTLVGFRSVVRMTTSMVLVGAGCAVVLGLFVFSTVPRRAPGQTAPAQVVPSGVPPTGPVANVSGTIAQPDTPELADSSAPGAAPSGVPALPERDGDRRNSNSRQSRAAPMKLSIAPPDKPPAAPLASPTSSSSARSAPPKPQSDEPIETER